MVDRIRSRSFSCSSRCPPSALCPLGRPHVLPSHCSGGDRAIPSGTKPLRGGGGLHSKAHHGARAAIPEGFREVRGVFVARRAQRSFRASSIASTRTPLAAWRRRFAPTRSN